MKNLKHNADQIPVIPLFCLNCCEQHVDEGGWAEKPHHKHLCSNCGFIWRVEPYCYGAPKDPSQNGFWGRAAARLTHKIKGLEEWQQQTLPLLGGLAQILKRIVVNAKDRKVEERAILDLQLIDRLVKEVPDLKESLDELALKGRDGG